MKSTEKPITHYYIEVTGLEQATGRTEVLYSRTMRQFDKAQGRLLHNALIYARAVEMTASLYKVEGDHRKKLQEVRRAFSHAPNLREEYLGVPSLAIEEPEVLTVYRGGKYKVPLVTLDLWRSYERKEADFIRRAEEYLQEVNARMNKEEEELEDWLGSWGEVVQAVPDEEEEEDSPF